MNGPIPARRRSAYAIAATLGLAMMMQTPSSSAQIRDDRSTTRPRKEEMPKPQRKEKPKPKKKRPDAQPRPYDLEVELEEEEEEEEAPAGNVVVPLILYSPETHLSLGAFGLHFFRFPGEPASTRVSSLAGVVLGTTRRQLIVEFLPELYWDDDGFHVDAKLEYQHFPNSFWGIGDDTPDDAEERYVRNRFRFKGLGRRRVIGPLYLGLYWDLMLLRPHYTDTNGIFLTTDVPGEEGGVTFGLGPSAQFDTRDNTVETHSGTLLSVTYNRFDDVWGSEYDFNKLVVDGRQFFPTWKDQALGLRAWWELNGGDVPYELMAMIGGDELLRGYFLGRYRDKNLLAVEAEYRFPIVWLFRGVVFAGAAEVADDVGNTDLDPIRWAAGGGLRFALNQRERLNMRFDFGIGPGTHGFYLSAAEAF